MNRARDFLAGMEEKTAFRACVFAAILVLMAATMFLLNVHTPLQMDDYDYSFSWSTGKPLAGVADVLASQAAHYRLWGGRSVVHTLAQLFLYWGKGVFNIANTAAYMLLVLELYALTRAGGPMLTAKLLKLCMEKKDVRGSTGTIHYDAGQIRFEAGER